MSIKRGPDGFPVEVPTTVTKKDDASIVGNSQTKIVVNLDDQPSSETPTVFTDVNASSDNSNDSLFLDEPTTVIAGSSPKKPVAETTEAPDEPKTTIARGKQKSNHSISGGSTVVESRSNATDSNAMADPVAGWLVVIAGAGQGNFMKLGYGQNTIGRNANERVCIDFGDSQISRANHAVVTYDPRGRQFYIQPGSGTNLVYIDDNEVPVLQPMLLNPLSHIHLGDTTLRFIPFCSKDFCWEELEEK